MEEKKSINVESTANEGDKKSSKNPKKFLDFIGMCNTEQRTSVGSIILSSAFLIVIIVEFYCVFKKTYSKNYNFSGKVVLESLKKSTVIPVFVTFIGFMEIIERVFGVEQKRIKRLFSWIIFFICLTIIIFSFTGCSNAYADNIEKRSIPRSSIIQDYHVDTFHYRVDIESALDTKFYKFTLIKNDEKLENIQKYLKNILDNVFVSPYSDISLLPDLLDERKDRLKDFNELFASAHDSITKQNLQRLYILTSLIPIDAFCRNQDEFIQINKEFEYERSLEELLRWVEKRPIIKDESEIENVRYLGSIENLKGVIYALRNTPQSKLKLRQELLSNVERLCATLLECEESLTNLKSDTLACDRLLNSISQWRLDNEKNNKSGNRENIILVPEKTKYLGLPDSLTLTLMLGTEGSGALLDSLESRVTTQDQKIKDNLNSKQKLYSSYIEAVKLKKQKIVSSLIAKNDKIGPLVQDLANTGEGFENINIDESKVQELTAIINTQLNSADSNEGDDNRNYDICANIFNDSFQIYKKAISDLGSRSSDEMFEKSLIPQMNLFISGLNWDIPLLTNIDKIDPGMQEFVLNKLQGVIDLYNTTKKLEMDTLRTKIESLRLYFNNGSEVVMPESENKLGELALDVVRLADLAKYFNQKFTIQIHGHNGASMESYSNVVKYDIKQRPLEIIACWIAVKRSLYVKNLMNTYNIDSYFTSFSIQDYEDSVKAFDETGKYNDLLLEILWHVQPFQIVEQSVTFKVIFQDIN